jgi:hypothetical protein
MTPPTRRLIPTHLIPKKREYDLQSGERCRYSQRGPLDFFVWYDLNLQFGSYM